MFQNVVNGVQIKFAVNRFRVCCIHDNEATVGKVTLCNTPVVTLKLVKFIGCQRLEFKSVVGLHFCVCGVVGRYISTSP